MLRDCTVNVPAAAYLGLKTFLVKFIKNFQKKLFFLLKAHKFSVKQLKVRILKRAQWTTLRYPLICEQPHISDVGKVSAMDCRSF